MKACHILEDSVLVKRGVDILIKKLGPLDARRFLAMTVNRRANSVKRHREWQGALEKNLFFDEVFTAQ